MYGFQVCKFVIVCIDTHAEKEACIATVYNLVIPELEETNMVGLGQIGDSDEEICIPQRSWIDISGRAPQLPDALHHEDGAVVQGCNPTDLSHGDPRERTFSSSSYGTYHFDNRVLPWRF